ncbi:hypothetical protein [Caulobacter sp. 17J80-11]|uniref:hypothetical protein n=1 Tax=Caulobacter sp. 17J80-11 TaxID=2763502 RepID=UPI001653E035|nr:hypothetical protein [Caulobacter sp. 17J80-11]MBC6982482.1 hypothetical protein [Caulobacter sp. 17J80-11]
MTAAAIATHSPADTAAAALSATIGGQRRVPRDRLCADDARVGPAPIVSKRDIDNS